MSLILANNASVLSGTLHMELYGIPTYDIVIDKADGKDFNEGTAVTIDCNGGLTLKGTVVQTGDFLDTMHVRIVGGKNGMGKTAKARGYAQPSALAKDVIGDLLNDAGESNSSDSSQAIANTNLTAWSTTTRRVSECLDVLLEYVAPLAGWRILADGTVRIGEESWPDSSDEFVSINQDPVDRHFHLGVDVPTIIPGVTIADVGRVEIVEHRITKDSIVSLVWTQVGFDRGTGEAMRQIAQQALAKIDYFTTYDVTVKSQSADLSTVDVMPPSDIKNLAGLQRVPLIHGLPGCKVQVPAGVTVNLGWYRGDPRKPYAALWPNDCDVTRIQLAGNTDAARKGDHSDAGTWVFAFGAGSGAATLSITYTDPDGTVTTLPVGSGSVPAKGKLTEGSTKVGLG